MNKQYLGDGAYIEWDEYSGQLVLTAENGTEVTSTIYLGPVEYKALVRYVENIKDRGGESETKRMKEPCTCFMCGEWVEMQESGSCDRCRKWFCNSCTYENEGVLRCLQCYENFIGKD